MKRHTKIVATIGPATEDYTQICRLIQAGMNVARLNCSHGTEEQFKKIVRNLRKAAKAKNKIITIMQDLQGPKIRVGDLEDPYPVKKGQVVEFSTSKKTGLYIPDCSDLPKMLKEGDALLIEDGMIRTKVLSTGKDFIKVKVIHGGLIKSHKGINIPDSTLPSQAALTRKDRKDLEFGLKTLKVDAVALSFVQNAGDIEEARRLAKKYSTKHVPIIAKIERREALKNLDEIIDMADGIMVARGDLGIEIPAEQVPIEQKRMVALARRKGKPSIIATQILQSMVENPLPTRAEISDAAHAIFQHTDAFMLSNESAVGKHPLKAVKTLANVASTIEKAMFKDADLFIAAPLPNCCDIEDENMAMSACSMAMKVGAKAIVVVTKEGFTARMVLKHRPETPVILVTSTDRIQSTLNFLWGAHTMVTHKGARDSESIKKLLKEKNLLKKGDPYIFIKLSDHKRSLVAQTA